MITKKIAYLSICIFALVPICAQAETLSAESDIKVKIIEAMVFSHDGAEHLNFGTIMSSANHTVRILNNGTRTGSDTTQLINDNNTPSADRFKITSPESRAVSLSILTPAKVGQVGVVPTLHTDPPSSGGKINLNKGENNFSVYGELAVTKGATAGDYTEPYTINVTY